jgi:putative membrane protein
MLSPVLAKNDKKAAWLIGISSFVVFAAVVLLSKFKLTNVGLGFNPHAFATFNAIVNSIVSVLLVLGLVAVKLRKYSLHKKIMFTAMVLSILFLVSYICHHLFAGETKFGDLDHSGALDAAEKASAGSLRIVYYILLITHIPLAAIVLPFILFTAYRGMIAEWPGHRKLARITWPIWFYVAVTGVVVYLMINPYY